MGTIIQEVWKLEGHYWVNIVTGEKQHISEM